MPSCTSTSCSGARSMYEYSLTAPTSFTMRPTASSTWSSRLDAPSAAAIQFRLAFSSLDPSSFAVRSRKSVSKPAVVNVVAKLHALSTAMPIQPAANLVLGVGKVDRAARLDRRARCSPACNSARRWSCSDERPASAIHPTAFCNCRTLSRKSAVARSAAAAGLFTSCARPAESRPSEIRRSRSRTVASMPSRRCR